MKKTALLLILIILSNGLFAQKPQVTDVWVVFKTHFDLGYTDLPENVFERYRVEMMENVLDVIEKNAQLPAEKHFAWTVAGWPLEAQILGSLQSPERRARIEKAIREGSLVVHGLPFTMHTGSLEYEELVRGLGYSSAVNRAYGLPLSISAKMTDVPSHSWGLPTLLNHAGITFLQLGCNAASQFPRFPELFWWEGPDGSKVLCHYTEWYGSDIKPTNTWPHKNYLAMQMTGDNHGPPTEEEIDKLLAYAEKEMPGIKIHFGTLDDFAKAILKENPILPTVKGDTPDGWVYGLMAMPQESKIARNIRPLEPALDVLNTQMNIWGINMSPLAEKLAKAYEQSLLYGEHTWGMSGGRGPAFIYGDEWKQWVTEAKEELLAEKNDKANSQKGNSQETKVRKKAKWLKSYDAHRQYIYNARDIVIHELDSRLNLLAKSVNVPGRRMVVYNALPWKRSGIVEVPWGKEKSIYVEDVPANGYIAISENELKSETEQENKPNASVKDNVLITPHFTAVFDLDRGGISSLKDNKYNRELVDQSSEYVIGQFLHERFSSNEIDLWKNTYGISNIWGIHDYGKYGMPDAGEVPYLAFTPDNWELSVSHTHTADVAVLSSTETEGFAKRYDLIFTFPHDEAYVDVEWKVDTKTAEKHPVGGWLCFPFSVEKPIWTIGRPGGPIDPAMDIIPGSSRYLMVVNTGVTVSQADDTGISLCALDSPLLSCGEPGLWKFSMHYVPRIPTVFINLYNNMWNTNFPLWQEGSWTERVRIWPKPKDKQTVANLTKKSWEARLPLLVGTAEGKAGKLERKKLGLTLSREGILVTAFGANPDGEGTILRFWEQAGRSGNAIVTFPEHTKYHRAIPVNLRGEKKGEAMKIFSGKFEFELGAYAPASFVLLP